MFYLKLLSVINMLIFFLIFALGALSGTMLFIAVALLDLVMLAYVFSYIDLLERLQSNRRAYRRVSKRVFSYALLLHVINLIGVCVLGGVYICCFC